MHLVLFVAIKLTSYQKAI